MPAIPNDIFNDGNVENFRWLQNFGSKGARGNQKLVMVPAGHGGLGGEKSDVEYNQPGAVVPPTESFSTTQFARATATAAIRTMWR